MSPARTASEVLFHWTSLRCPGCGVWTRTQSMELRTVVLAPELGGAMAVVDCPACHDAWDPVTHELRPQVRADGFPRMIRELRGLSTSYEEEGGQDAGVQWVREE